MYLQRLAGEFKLDRQTLKTQLDQLRQQLGIHNQPWIKQQPSLARHQQFQQTSEEEQQKLNLVGLN